MTPQDAKRNDRTVHLVLSRPGEPVRFAVVRLDPVGRAEQAAQRCRELAYSEDCRQDRTEPRATLPGAYRQLRPFHVRRGRYLADTESVIEQEVEVGDVLVLGRIDVDSMVRDVMLRQIPDRVDDGPGMEHQPGSSLDSPIVGTGPSGHHNSALKPGDELGRFRIVRRLGGGGQGSVYHALTPEWGECVLKRLEHAGLFESDEEARFEREAKLLQAASHPNLVRCDGLFEHAGRQYLVMEKLEGISLRRLLVNTGALPFPLFSLLATQLVSAVAHLHAMEPNPIVHRDIKPENVLVVIGADGQFVAKLLDFGLAKHHGHDSFHDTFSTALDTPPAGTPQYVPPELLNGQPRGLTGDVFTLGAVLYEMYHGVLAFPAQGEDLWAQIRAASPARLPGTPYPLRDVLQRCLEKRPAERYPTARELLLELDHALGQLGGRPATPANDSRTTERLSQAGES